MTGKAPSPKRTAARPIFRLTLTPEPDAMRPILALRKLLKALLRAYGLKCLSVEEVHDEQER